MKTTLSTADKMSWVDAKQQSIIKIEALNSQTIQLK